MRAGTSQNLGTGSSTVVLVYKSLTAQWVAATGGSKKPQNAMLEKAKTRICFVGRTLSNSLLASLHRLKPVIDDVICRDGASLHGKLKLPDALIKNGHVEKLGVLLTKAWRRACRPPYNNGRRCACQASPHLSDDCLQCRADCDIASALWGGGLLLPKPATATI